MNEMAYAMNSLCVANLGMGQLQEALENCNTAIRHDSTLWQAWNNRGNVHFFLRVYGKALADYQKAHGFEPDEVSLAQIESNIALVQGLIAQEKTQ
jgi:tetratricopeptide (TPR) repeat protein